MELDDKNEREILIIFFNMEIGSDYCNVYKFISHVVESLWIALLSVNSL